MRYEQLQGIYAGEGYYWGTEPNGFARRTLGFLEEPEELRAVELGAGEGRDAVLFAERGLRTLAVDISPNGLAKTESLARERGVEIASRQGEVNLAFFGETFDLVCSIGAVRYIEPERRADRFEHLKEATSPLGIHALLSFVEHPDVPPAPDCGDNEYLYAPGELRDYLAGWECLHACDFLFDEDSGSEPHQHEVEEYVFRKPGSGG